MPNFKIHLHRSKIITTFAAQFKIERIMKKFLFIAISAIALIACKQPVANPETPTDPTDTTQTTPTDTTVTPPAQAQAVYVKGFRIDGIYLVNLMYRVEFVGHNLYDTDTPIIKTDYSAIALNKSNIPYYMPLATPVKIGDMPDPFDWYKEFVISAYAAAKTTADGAQCLSVTMPAALLDGVTEHTAVSSNGTRVTILLEYK